MESETYETVAISTVQQGVYMYSRDSDDGRKGKYICKG